VKIKNILTIIFLILAVLAHAAVACLYFAGQHFVLQIILFSAELVLLGLAFIDMDRQGKTGISPGRVLDKNEIMALAAFSALALLLYMFDYKSWKYSAIGDEWHFFEYARDLAAGIVPPNIFSENGVYDLPVMSSVYQAVFMKLFGPLLGWKLSSAVIVPLCVLPFYAWCKMVYNRNTAVIAAAAFATSVAMLAFGHIGYINIHDVLFYIYALFFLELAISGNSSFYSFLTALVMGIGCYTFHPARLMILVCVMYYAMHPRRKDLSRANRAVIICVYAAIASFLVLKQDFFTNMIARTFAQPPAMNPEFVPAGQKAVFAALNFTMSFFVFVFNNDATRFVRGGLAGVLGAAGCAAGMAMIVMGFKKDWRMRFSGAVLLLFAFFLGALSPYWYPPNSRTQFMAPLLSVLTASGCMFFIDKLADKKGRFKTALVAAGLLAVSNAISFYYIMPSKNIFTDLAYVIKAVQDQPPDRKLYLVNAGFYTFDRMGLHHIYGFDKRFAGAPGIDRQVQEDVLRDRTCIFTAETLADRPRIRQLGEAMTNNNGKTVLYVFNFYNNERNYSDFKLAWGLK
jgi:hypothetical protein